MRRLEVVACVVVGFLAVLAIAIGPAEIAAPIAFVVELALEYWYVGLVVLVAAVVIRRRATAPTAGRVLGFIGVTWTATFVAFYVIVVLYLLLGSPIGP